MTTSNTKDLAVNVLQLADDWVHSVATTGKAVQVPAHDILLTRDADVRQTPEARLQAQVADLDRLFVGLAQRAAQAGNVHATDLLLRLALRCQQQATRAVATLADMKAKHRPSVVDIEDIEIVD